MENEFLYFATPESFLNNPTREVALTLPRSLYRRFSFEYGGLTSNELFNYEQDNPSKYAAQKSGLYSEVKEELEELLETASRIKVQLMKRSDDLILERMIEKYTVSFAGQTCGRLQESDGPCRTLNSGKSSPAFSVNSVRA